MAATACENVSPGFFVGALEHQVFEKVREPDLPGVSSAAPTLYQIICVTTGAR